MDVTGGRRRLRAAVIGMGFVGPHHVDAVRRGGIGEVALLVGREDGRTREAADRLGVGRWTVDAATAVADPDIDVVHVCTPNATHEALALAALDAGKHLVIEKPVATDLAAAVRIRDRARAVGRHAVVAFTYRGYPQVRKAREVLAAGTLGDVRLVRGAYLQDWLLDPSVWNWRIDPGLGGSSRAVADIGSHWFDTVEFVTGLRATAVFAELSTFVPVRSGPDGATGTFDGAASTGAATAVRTEDAAAILVRFDGGASGSVVVSQVSPGRKNDLVVAIDGSLRALEWRQEDPEHLALGGLGGWEVLAREKPATAGPGIPALPTGHPEGWGEAMRDLLRPFYEAVAAGADPDPALAQPYPTLAAGVRAVAFTEAVVESSRRAAWVPLAAVDL